jgi:hypothetical protein
MQAIRNGTMLPSLSQNKIGTSEFDPFRSSILGPSPVNASRRPSRDAAHHSGLVLTPWGTFTSYSLPAFLAHSELGQTEKNSV